MPIKDQNMTIGIGAFCEDAECAVLATDTRVTFGQAPSAPFTDNAGKQFDFPPLLLAASIAGSTSSAQVVISEFANQLRPLVHQKLKDGKMLVAEHVRICLDRARREELRRLQGCAMETELGVGLYDWLSGNLPDARKLDDLALRYGLQVLRRVQSEMKSRLGVIVVGFVDNGAVFMRGSGFEPMEIAASPEFFLIGSGSSVALEVLDERKQRISMTLARTLLHVHEALKSAKIRSRSVGPPSWYVVIMSKAKHPPAGAMLRFPANPQLLSEWSRAYKKRNDTSSLDGHVPNVQAKALLQFHIPKRSQSLAHETLALAQ